MSVCIFLVFVANLIRLSRSNTTATLRCLTESSQELRQANQRFLRFNDGKPSAHQKVQKVTGAMRVNIELPYCMTRVRHFGSSFTSVFVTYTATLSSN